MVVMVMLAIVRMMLIAVVMIVMAIVVIVTDLPTTNLCSLNHYLTPQR